MAVRQASMTAGGPKGTGGRAGRAGGWGGGGGAQWAIGVLIVKPTWQGAMAVRQASMTAGGPKGSVTAPLEVPDRAEPAARNWEGSGWGGIID